MRLKLTKSKQRELILSFKIENNLTWQELATLLNVKRGALLEWYHENNLIPKIIFEKLDSNNNYYKYILEEKSDNWGRQKGGLLSTGTTKSITSPKYSKKLAELIGIVLGDGNLHMLNKQSYMLRIAGHSVLDKDYLSNYVYRLCYDLFNISPKIYYSKRSQEMLVLVHSKAVVEFLIGAGLFTGNKITTKVDIPHWIIDNKSYIQACLRGLIDTDGSIFRMSNKDPHLLRLSFTNYNITLLTSTRNAFIALGYFPSKIITGHSFFISRKTDIVKYLKEIRFSNQKHIKRLNKFIAP
jgi:intein/homing endonuclease